jgi:F0F1-type ATP synthase assembly protein I
VLNNSPFWLIVFLVLGIAGFVLQYMHNRNCEVTTYNRMSDTTVSA